MLELIQKNYDSQSDSSLGCANIFSFLSLNEGEVVLDLGCGNGREASLIAKKVGKSGKVYGLDITPAMIEKAKINYFHQENLFFLLGDIHSLPFEDGFFDIVVSNCVINHSLDKRRVYQEIYRVLKPNSSFLIGDIVSKERLPERIRNNPEAIAQCFGGAIPKEEYLDIIQSVGFQEIKILHQRSYWKNGFLLESIIVWGVKQ